MSDVSINFLAILVCGVVYMVLGSLWYSPLLFGKIWMRFMDKSEEELKEMQKGVWKSYVLSFIGSLVMAYVLAHIIKYAEGKTVLDGFMSGISVWFGFVVTTHLAPVLFEGRRPELYVINSFYNLVSLVIMGIVLTVWV